MYHNHGHYQFKLVHDALFFLCIFPPKWSDCYGPQVFGLLSSVIFYFDHVLIIYFHISCCLSLSFVSVQLFSLFVFFYLFHQISICFCLVFRFPFPFHSLCFHPHLSLSFCSPSQLLIISPLAPARSPSALTYQKNRLVRIRSSVFFVISTPSSVCLNSLVTLSSTQSFI